MNKHTQAILDEMDITLTCDRLMAPHKGQILAYLEQILTANEGEWISVEDELPKTGWYFCYSPSDYGYHVARYQTHDRRWWPNYYGQDIECHITEVTHWQPLPAPPKEGE